MFKKWLAVFFFSSLIMPPCFAEERFNGGVSFDFEVEETKTEQIQKSLPPIEKGFVDLNYSIDYKPMSLLSKEDIKIKKKIISSPKYQNAEAIPGEYEISISTKNISNKTDSSNTIKDLLKSDPNNRELLFAYAIQLKNEDELEAALKAAEKALDIDPDFALAHFLKGDILRAMERFKEACEEYIYTTQINPYCSDAYFNIAKILELLDNKELALDYYRTAYQIDPNDTEIRDIILEHYIDL